MPAEVGAEVRVDLAFVVLVNAVNVDALDHLERDVPLAGPGYEAVGHEAVQVVLGGGVLGHNVLFQHAGEDGLGHLHVGALSGAGPASEAEGDEASLGDGLALWRVASRGVEEGVSLECS